MASLNVKVHLSIMSIVQLDFVKVYQYLALRQDTGLDCGTVSDSFVRVDSPERRVGKLSDFD